MFLLNKASPLSAVESASFSKLVDQNALATHIASFCSSANLLCFPDLSPSLEKHDKNVNFAVYQLQKFTNFGTDRLVGVDEYKTYFSNYGKEPEKHFKSYGNGGNSAIDTFSIYRDQSNVGDDPFQSYAKSSNGGKVTFKDYAKKGVSFANYINQSSAELTSTANSGKPVNRWVEPGKFFRERMLKTETVIPMPDIRDKMPKRSFLPRVISSKLSFSTSKLSDLKRIFHAGDNSTMETILTEALSECEREPSQGETKRCVGSAEDMIDFATSVLGRNVVVRTTQNTDGSAKDVMIGSVKGINGGKGTGSGDMIPIL
ncbi:hypothetical protein U1Q18_017031 [Sarracenia purpurea var. burkii]